MTPEEWENKRFTQLSCPTCGPNLVLSGKNGIFMCTGCGSIMKMDSPSCKEVFVEEKNA